MFARLGFIAIGFFMASSASAPAVEPPGDGPLHGGCGKAAAAAWLERPALSSAEASREEALRGARDDTDLLHCDLEIEVFPPGSLISAGSSTSGFMAPVIPNTRLAGTMSKSIRSIT